MKEIVMSVNLREVIEAAGYDLSKKDDMIWLISKVSEFEELVVEVEDKLEELEELEELNGRN